MLDDIEHYYYIHSLIWMQGGLVSHPLQHRQSLSLAVIIGNCLIGVTSSLRHNPRQIGRGSLLKAARPLVTAEKQRCGYASTTATISIDLGSTITI